MRKLEAIKYACRILCRRWVLSLLYSLSKEPKRFSEIQQSIPGLSTKSLGRLLLSLEKEGIISRTVEPTRPPRVLYELNDDPTIRRITALAVKWGKNRAAQAA